ncbi:hypothetical protein [Mycobacteroides abscessus]|uniref:hypothetical protein n=1 Tax=Mycobacteroides abscessus TaxID=36809 RepID=UPI00034554EB|nr:hypothetical protein [Mycobacteroides abscessus]SHQ39052.1 Uncharacterised protein [Mycobacteroides abscessus subsp. abscessus]SHU70110.1 Uncharacterised protein [Mycobacteroides abscessus subsp. abscessus]SHV56764.1 Uncharacterised protein [Mycobacteroides abscessus subsp. abscessus]SHV70681.1 Uncharacterised protein [Mycobacteroides abscessus subsp. abscessus]SHW47905.1 Uncharacterised protein [Mycobacteroides abscessus subsp. abscessus]
MRRTRPGDADRIAELCSDAGKPLQPWQIQFLTRLEQHDTDVQFAEMVRGFNR